MLLQLTQPITMAFELPALPYGYSALEPYVDTTTMNIHHTKHHAVRAGSAAALLDLNSRHRHA